MKTESDNAANVIKKISWNCCGIKFREFLIFSILQKFHEFFHDEFKLLIERKTHIEKIYKKNSSTIVSRLQSNSSMSLI
jgi:iron-sulfur cluster repair protein YtfE (RIC family)